MGSALRKRGSTTRWRRIRRRILERDRHLCQWPVDGGICGARAIDCGHIVSRHLWPAGVPGVDDDGNLRAECIRHNRRAGALIRNGKDPATPPFPHYRRTE